jgi:DNA-nicking Smr family endonuclease
MNYQQLSNHINTDNIVYADSILEYKASGILLNAWKNFKQGNFIIEAKLDLHGSTAVEAEQLFINFFNKLQQNGMRYGLIIHGKGGKYHEPPVLKNLVNVWLKQLPEILAFHSAQSKHGGTGAVYFWLKSQ